MPPSAIAYCASLSGKVGEHAIFAILFPPLPFLNANLVVLACAMMLPPIGFCAFAPANIPPSGFATTWLETTTPVPNSLANFAKPLKNFPNAICLADNSPLPSNSVRNKFVAESTRMSEKWSNCWKRWRQISQ